MRTTLFLLALAVAACGDDGGSPDAGPTATDYDGTWLISSVTLPGTGTLTRDGTPVAFRGDAVFRATSATTGTLDVRQVILRDGLIDSEVMAFTIGVTVEPGRWLLTETDGVSVYTAALTGEHLVLTLDAADPRTTSPDPATAIIVDRVAPWSTAVVGTWDLVSMTFTDRTIVAETCVALQPGVVWGRLSMKITFDVRLRFMRTMTTSTYSDEGCATLTGTQTALQTGLAEEEGGAALRMWGVEDDRAEYISFSIAASDERMTLARTGCLPLPACEDDAPTTVVVAPGVPPR